MAVCEVLGIEDPVVYGVSFGGMVTLHYAVRHPGHARRVILDSTAAVLDLPASLGAVTAPVLLLAGEDDPVSPAAGARALAAELGPQRCRLEVFADCGHGVWRDQPDAAFAAIRAFVTAD